MIDISNGAQGCAPAHRNHFHGNGNCDATREANKREDRVSAAAASGTRAAMSTGNMPAARAGMNNGAQEYTGMESELVPYGNMTGAAAPYGGMTAEGGTAAEGYNDPEYGPEHDWTAEEEDGMNSVPQESFTEPLNADEAARNSWRALLARNVGRNVLVRFLMGTQNLVTVEGELYEVGTDYIVIYQPLWDSHITADLYSVKFVEFREPPGVMTLA